MEIDIIKNLTNKIELQNVKEIQSFEKVIFNVIDKGSDYILKAMPIQENLKDVLIDVRNSFKTKDFSKIIETAVNSSIREGIEFLTSPASVLKDLNKIKEVANKGGLKQALITGIDILTDKNIKNNLFGDVIKKFVEEVKTMILSNKFNIKVDEEIKKINLKQENFKSLCTDWYKAYDKLDIENINKLSKEINDKQKSYVYSSDVLKSARTIQNITEFVNNKKDKLSANQLDICKNL